MSIVILLMRVKVVQHTDDRFADLVIKDQMVIIFKKAQDETATDLIHDVIVTQIFWLIYT